MSELTYATLDGDTVRVYRHTITQTKAVIRDRRHKTRVVNRAELSNIHDAPAQVTFMDPSEKRDVLIRAAINSYRGVPADRPGDPLHDLVPDDSAAHHVIVATNRITGAPFAHRVGEPVPPNLGQLIRARLRAWAAERL